MTSEIIANNRENNDIANNREKMTLKIVAKIRENNDVDKVLHVAEI